MIWTFWRNDVTIIQTPVEQYIFPLRFKSRFKTYVQFILFWITRELYECSFFHSHQISRWQQPLCRWSCPLRSQAFVTTLDSRMMMRIVQFVSLLILGYFSLMYDTSVLYVYFWLILWLLMVYAQVPSNETVAHISLPAGKANRIVSYVLELSAG